MYVRAPESEHQDVIILEVIANSSSYYSVLNYRFQNYVLKIYFGVGDHHHFIFSSIMQSFPIACTRILHSCAIRTVGDLISDKINVFSIYSMFMLS